MNALVPHTPAAPPSFGMNDIERIAKAFAASRMFGVQNAEQALALCLIAQAEGRHPATAAQDYSIIQNRPSKKADAMLRDFLASGGKVQWHALTNEKVEATFQHPAGGSVTIDWTMQRANQAGIKNAMYAKYPRQMLRARVVSEGVRTVCPGATSGMYVPEEVQDFEPIRAAPQQALAAPEPQAEDAEFEPTPQPVKSAAQARKDGDYERLTTAMREAAARGETDLAGWAKMEADAIGALPHGWQKNLREEYVELRDGIRAKAADPHGLKVDVPSLIEAKLDDWEAYLEDVLNVIRGAPDAEQVKEAQIVNGMGLTGAALEIADAEEQVAKAVEQRLAELGAGGD